MLQEAQKRFESILYGKAMRPIAADLENFKPPMGNFSINNGAINIQTECGYDDTSTVYDLAKTLCPWRKGPFKIDDIFIDSEWNSSIKFDFLAEHIDVTDKVVGDIGCNNGYYLFRMLQKGAKELIGLDPGVIFYLQFKFINAFLRSDIKFYPYGVEHLDALGIKFDLLFCLGVIYHRSDPISTLKSLKNALQPNGELILDSIIIDGDDEIALCPKDTYAKMSNVFFLPTKKTLQNWLDRVGFEYEFLGEMPTTLSEQRKTDWIYGQSLEDFLDKDNQNLTVEGYPAPKRAYYKCRRING